MPDIVQSGGDQFRETQFRPPPPGGPHMGPPGRVRDTSSEAKAKLAATCQPDGRGSAGRPRRQNGSDWQHRLMGARAGGVIRRVNWGAVYVIWGWLEIVRTDFAQRHRTGG